MARSKKITTRKKGVRSQKPNPKKAKRRVRFSRKPRGKQKISRKARKRFLIDKRKVRPNRKKVSKKRSVAPRRKPARQNKLNPVVRKLAYILNTDFGSFFELRDLILKSLPAEKDTMVEKINKLGRVKLAVISGVFMNKDNADPYIPDLLIVGDDLDKRKLRSFLKAIEAEVGKEVKYVILDKEEFQYRLAMFDRFIRVLLESPHEKLINRLVI